MRMCRVLRGAKYFIKHIVSILSKTVPNIPKHLKALMTFQIIHFTFFYF